MLLEHSIMIFPSGIRDQWQRWRTVRYIFSITQHSTECTGIPNLCYFSSLFVLCALCVRFGWWVVFYNAWTFNGNVSEWNVGQVTKMKYSKSYLLNWSMLCSLSLVMYSYYDNMILLWFMILCLVICLPLLYVRLVGSVQVGVRIQWQCVQVGHGSCDGHGRK